MIAFEEVHIAIENADRHMKSMKIVNKISQNDVPETFGGF